MNRLVKTLNKYNGNICFSGVTIGPTFHIFECSANGTITTAQSASMIQDVAVFDESLYYVALGNNFLGSFSSGILNSTYFNTGLSSADRIETNSLNDLYVLNKTSNDLVKFSSEVLQWTFSLPDFLLKDHGEIILKNNQTVIYHNNQKTYIIRDDLTKGTLLSSINFSDCSNDLHIVNGGSLNAYHLFGRLRQNSGENLDFSSSSSSIDSSSSSS